MKSYIRTSLTIGVAFLLLVAALLLINGGQQAIASTIDESVMVDYTLSGTVSEVYSGLPLYAQITLVGSGLDPFWTDPATGFYTITLPAASYTVQVKSEGYLAEEQTVNLAADTTVNFVLDPVPCILIIDDDQNVGGTDQLEKYTNALDQLFMQYFVWDVAEDGDPASIDMIGYPIVIWFTGYVYEGTLNGANETAVTAYLNSGGNFFLSSQGYLTGNALTDFGQDYLHLADTVSNVDVLSVEGIYAFDGVGTLDLAYAYDNVSDFVVPDLQATGAFTGTTATEEGLAGLTYDGDYNTIFLSFPFEAITSLTDRTDVMEAALTFLGGCPVCVPTDNTSFIYLPEIPFAGETVVFTGTATGSDPIGYTWDFGDGSTADGQVVSHIFAEGGDYGVQLDSINACAADSDKYLDVLNVLNRQNIEVSPVTIAVTLTQGSFSSLDLTISNSGDVSLTWSLAENPAADWLTENLTSGEIGALGSQAVKLYFAAGTLAGGQYTTTLEISSNDPDEPIVTVPVVLNVVQTYRNYLPLVHKDLVQ